MPQASYAATGRRCACAFVASRDVVSTLRRITHFGRLRFANRYPQAQHRGIMISMRALRPASASSLAGRRPSYAIPIESLAALLSFEHQCCMNIYSYIRCSYNVVRPLSIDFTLACWVPLPTHSWHKSTSIWTRQRHVSRNLHLPSINPARHLAEQLPAGTNNSRYTTVP